MRATDYRAERFLLGEAFPANCDCTIADIHTPGMGGLDLIQELQGQVVIIPVILIMALPDVLLVKEAVSIAALCLLRKSFEMRVICFDYVERSLLR